jgi:hypothetical protein
LDGKKSRLLRMMNTRIIRITILRTGFFRLAMGFSDWVFEISKKMAGMLP